LRTNVTAKKRQKKSRKHKGGNRTKVTAEKKEEFLLQLVETGGNVTKAAELVAIARKCFYEHRRQDGEFEKQWDEAVDRGIDRLEDEARRRALNGVDEPILYKGEIVEYVRKYSDTLLIFLLKGHREKYRDRHEITGKMESDVKITGLAKIFEGVDTKTIQRLLAALRNGDPKKRTPPMVSRITGSQKHEG